MEHKYWPYITFVGHMETVYDDSRRFLEQIGASDEHGMSGWGENETESVFRQAFPVEGMQRMLVSYWKRIWQRRHWSF
jgi:hypothetical protein